LTNAELIKALFINDLRSDNREIQQLMQSELATEWDQIEQTLSDDSFWYFIIQERDKEKYETRIDFLFELLVGSRKEKSDRLYSYRKYAQDRDKRNWKNVKDLYLKLWEWYSDPENDLYHLIGVIICWEIRDIISIINESKNCKKHEFKDKLLKMISNELNNGNYNLGELYYKDSSQNKLIVNLLLLFNIDTYQTSEAHFRFPFDKFKKTKWSLEHIHAQKAEKFKTDVEVEAWINDTEILLNNWKDHVSRISKEEFIVKFKNFKDEIKKEEGKGENGQLTQEGKELLAAIMEYTNEFFDVHSMKNLALLDGPTNSSLSNKPYKGKREEILKIDQQKWKNSAGMIEKHFIPLCTKNAFLKYYTEEIIQMDFWGYQDREDYFANLIGTLKKYGLTNNIKENE